MSTMVIGIPFSGRSLPYRQLLSFNAWASSAPMNFNVRHFHAHERPIAEARNWFAEQAIECNAKYLFQWDEDVVVPPYAIRQLVYHLEHHEDWGLVGGIYCQKSEPASTVAPMVFKDNGQGPYWKWRVGELFEVASMGFGCSLLRVECLKDVEKPWFKTVRDFDAYWEAIPKAQFYSEDIWFCERLKKTDKWKIYADGAILCDHLDLNTGKAYNLPADSYPMQGLMVEKGKKKILDIGCGTNPYQTKEGEVITCDIREDVKPDYRCDVRRLPFGTGEFDIAYSSHVLEHLGRNETDETLDEWARIVKPGGELRLVLPNIAWAAEQIQKGTINNDVMNVLYGSQEYRENFHRTGFTPDLLKAQMKRLKFTMRFEDLQGFNIIIAAVKDGAKPLAKKKKKLPSKRK